MGELSNDVIRIYRKAVWDVSIDNADIAIPTVTICGLTNTNSVALSPQANYTN
jgi:hypothetical protein